MALAVVPSPSERARRTQIAASAAQDILRAQGYREMAETGEISREYLLNLADQAETEAIGKLATLGIDISRSRHSTRAGECGGLAEGA